MLVSEKFIAERDRLFRYQKATRFVDYLKRKRSRLSDPEDIEDIDSRIRHKQTFADKARKEIRDRIYLLDNEIYCEILELYFLCEVPLPEVADRLGYTERHIRKLYSEAINKLADEHNCDNQ